MEGRRDDVTGGAAAHGQRHCCRRRGGGGSGDESEGSSSGVELSLRLRTGDTTPAAAAAAARRSMTIFYNGRVCAVDVTEIQARAIISMANKEILAYQQQLRRDDGRQQDSDSGGSNAMERCARDGHLRPAAASPAGTPRQGQGLAVAAAPVIDQAATGLSMKRSLQRFLQKRKARTAAAVAPPYAGGRQAQATRH
ncbi:protein TIFY 5-like [Phragmites australis]|uniref:protein TIFY 5-like n=1 Tax=Phragmites australis TaxID=29695 RepID=UPI002D766C67|nr:protein TIFY 5-like [Phragmites australis]